MKKLMIAAAVVFAAVVTQAATISWGVSAVKMAKDATGAFGTGTAYQLKDYGTLSVYLIDSEKAFNDLAIDKIYSTYGTKKADFTTSTTGTGAATLTTDSIYSKSSGTIFAATILSYEDDDGQTWYIANKAGIQIGEDGDNAKVTSLHNKIGGVSNTGDLYSFTGSGTAITAWTAAESVPEPFSGTLALLGLGAIALRRKMKKAKKA